LKRGLILLGSVAWGDLETSQAGFDGSRIERNVCGVFGIALGGRDGVGLLIRRIVRGVA
jgi:hypothetical protein